MYTSHECWMEMEHIGCSKIIVGPLGSIYHFDWEFTKLTPNCRDGLLGWDFTLGFDYLETPNLIGLSARAQSHLTFFLFSFFFFTLLQRNIIKS